MLLAIFGSALAPEDPYASGLDVLAPPSAAHPLGTTEAGSDVLSQLMVGARVSIVVGFAAAIISAVLGAAVGLIGGFYGGVNGPAVGPFSKLVPVLPPRPPRGAVGRVVYPPLRLVVPPDG